MWAATLSKVTFSSLLPRNKQDAKHVASIGEVGGASFSSQFKKNLNQNGNHYFIRKL